MGLATIDPHSQESTPRFTKSQSLVVIEIVLTEIQRFIKSVNICKEMYGERCVGERPDGHTFLCKF